MNVSLLKKLSAYTLLYIEDEDGIRNNITEILDELFYKVVSANNISDALIKYKDNKPDLIITDIQLKGKTGIDFIKDIRENDSKTRVIITSAFTDLDYMLDAAELHLIKYIVKPITNDKLFDALESFLNSYEKNKVFNLNEDYLYNSENLTIKNTEEEFLLTKKESQFLNMLLNKNRLITYEELENNVWDEDSVMTPNAMRLFIKNFRKKLPKDLLKNIQGTGYKLNLV
ncbi:MAG: KDP operon transcriptional regulatory protein KdpE [Arcobacter lacus]|nr:MAG: KDP operon transcriptional regulatory protein KdpE [Arcobacter lacus]